MFVSHHYHGVSSIEARGGEVVIEIGGPESRETVEMVLGPFPHVTIDIVESHGGGWEHIHRLREREGERERKGEREGGRVRERREKR